MKPIRMLHRLLASSAAVFFTGRHRIAGIVLVLFLGVSLVTRLGLAVFNADWSYFAPWHLIPILALGVVYDLAAGLWFAVPFALFAWLAPAGRLGGWLLGVVSLAAIAIVAPLLAFVSASEFVFWNEFASRFNFIAVDYLIYTNEVLGNIRESYSLAPMLAAIAVAALILLALVARPVWRAACVQAGTFRRRAGTFALIVAAALAGFLVTDASYKDVAGDAQAVQLAGNGPWEFFHAFRRNEIDYHQFYATVPIEQAYRTLRAEFEHGAQARFTGNADLPIERDIVPSGPVKPLNVVMISVESLSADFLGVFGNRNGLTPNLDRLAGEGLLFTRLYATGTRTVRGLEALSLSIPPTPGHSIVKRPKNENLFTLGRVFGDKGYESLYIYGGYGYFDNMNHFFGSNGYTVVDRTAIAKEDIHYENIWGVADEDLFTLSLRELDRRHAAGRRFFAQVMTTSNHRPYTYPSDRIDIPSGTGRDGAVKYTDWAIGDFIRRAREHAWFDDTVFVIVADHCASSRGKTDLPLDRFHIPMIVYAPKHLQPRRIETIASQIDVPPTILGLLNVPYRSRFFGQVILADGPVQERALLANYQTVGYYEDGVIVSLRPRRSVVATDAATNAVLPDSPRVRALREEAIAYYLSASDAFRRGALRMPKKPTGVTDPS